MAECIYHVRRAGWVVSVVVLLAGCRTHVYVSKTPGEPIVDIED